MNHSIVLKVKIKQPFLWVGLDLELDYSMINEQEHTMKWNVWVTEDIYTENWIFGKCLMFNVQ